MTTLSTTPGVALGSNDQDLPAGFEVGEYKVEALIGKGGFGTVYRGVHPLIGKQVAIKVLARKYAADEAVVSRFVAEARAVNQIRHRNIIDIFQFSQLADGRHYYVMEYLDGEPLDQYLKANGPMPLASAIPILRAIAKALDAAHAKGIAHRDLKPENIYLARDPDGGVYPKLLDFGIAKLLAPDEDVRHRTGTGVPIGTPYYMSPEQCRGRDVDHRTDVYSFGIVTYRVLTGAYPFEGDDYMELLFKQVNEEPPPPSSKNPALPPSVDGAIAWMMKKDRDHRPPTIAEAMAALDPNGVETPSLPRTSVPSIAGHTPQVTPDAFAQTTASTTTPPPVARPRPAVWIGSALVLVCSAAGVALVLSHGSPDEAARSTSRRDEGSAPARTGMIADPGSTTVITAEPRADIKAHKPEQTKPTHDLKPLSIPTVTVTITNVPAGTRTRLGSTDYTLPGDVPVPRGAEPVVLVLWAPGYKTGKSIQVVPDKDTKVDGAIAPYRRPVSNARPNISDDPGGIIDLDHDQFRKQP